MSPSGDGRAGRARKRGLAAEPSETIRAEAFAKTNLALRVLGKRADGFHEIDTIFQTIDLTDALEAEATDGALTLACSDPAVPSGPENLVHRAASVLRNAFGVRRGARIRLEKRIPAGGGLGGGSSDAAVALVLLARLWEIAPSAADFSELGAALGSDVPFFFLGGTARGTGRGEVVEAIDEPPDRRLILVVPPFPIATREVYSRWRPGAKSEISGSVFGANELASAVLQTNPEMDRYRRTIARYFPDCQISGSGSALLAVDDERDPGRLGALTADLPEARILRTRTVSRSEYERRSTMEHASFGRR